MARLAAHGIALEPPPGWEARIFVPPGGAATLHAGSFALPITDGEYGPTAVRSMRASDAFAALTEFIPDKHLRPDAGLFANAQPRELRARDFSPHALPNTEPGRLGLQRFFSAAGRAFCLHLVLGSPRAKELRLHELDALLGSLAIRGPREPDRGCCTPEGGAARGGELPDL